MRALLHITLLLANLYGVFARFSSAEYERRLRVTQEYMRKEGLGALFGTMAVHHTYFIGVETEFWQSPTRPFYFIIPAEGKITVVTPSITTNLYEPWKKDVVGEIVDWPSPRPDDDGVTDLAKVLTEMSEGKPGQKFRIGAELGPETAMRMAVGDFLRLKGLMEGIGEFVDASRLLFKVRLVKSEEEIVVMRRHCQAQSRAFDNIPNVVHAGMTERDACRAARVELMKAGADRTPYMACRSGAGGYDNIVAAARERVLVEGDVLVLDSGSMRDYYFCDFNRNWYVGRKVPPALAKMQDYVYAAIEAGLRAGMPGNTTADVFHAMSAQMPGPESTVGRAGHSVGLAITEWPSIQSGKVNKQDIVTLEEGMVFSIEPSLGFGDDGQFLVHEECFVVRKNGFDLLSIRGPREMPLITKGLDGNAEL